MIYTEEHLEFQHTSSLSAGRRFESDSCSEIPLISLTAPSGSPGSTWARLNIRLPTQRARAYRRVLAARANTHIVLNPEPGSRRETATYCHFCILH